METPKILLRALVSFLFRNVTITDFFHLPPSLHLISDAWRHSRVKDETLTVPGTKENFSWVIIMGKPKDPSQSPRFWFQSVYFSFLILPNLLEGTSGVKPIKPPSPHLTRALIKYESPYLALILEFLTILNPSSKLCIFVKNGKPSLHMKRSYLQASFIFFELLTLHWQLIIDSYLSLKIASFVFDYFMIQRTRIKKRPQTRCKQTCKFFALLESRNNYKCWFKSEISSGWTTDLFSYMYFDECRAVLNFVFVFKFGFWKLWCVE